MAERRRRESPFAETTETRRRRSATVATRRRQRPSLVSVLTVGRTRRPIARRTAALAGMPLVGRRGRRPEPARRRRRRRAEMSPRFVEVVVTLGRRRRRVVTRAASNLVGTRGSRPLPMPRPEKRVENLSSQLHNNFLIC